MKMKETEYVKWAKRICKQCQSEKRDFCKFGYTDCQHLQKKRMKWLRPWWTTKEIAEGLKKLEIFTRDIEEKRKRGQEDFLKFLNELKERVEKRKKRQG